MPFYLLKIEKKNFAFFFILGKMAELNHSSRDHLMIITVRDKMRRQWDEDIVRNHMARNVCAHVALVDNSLTLLKKVGCFTDYIL